jgi:hypothetical protein
VADYVYPEGPPSFEKMAKAYYLTELRSSTAADVLPLLYMPEYSLLSQSTKVLAAQGTKDSGNKIWVTMVSFDENDLLAKRKYFIIIHDEPEHWFPVPWEGFRFDCQLVLEGEVLEEPYADENARRAAMLKFARDVVHDDIAEVKEDNKAFEVAGAMVNQSIEAVLTILDHSPALAARLSDEKGLDFSYHSFEKGRIGMTSDEKTMTIKLRVGEYVKKWNKVDKIDYPPETEESEK